MIMRRLAHRTPTPANKSSVDRTTRSFVWPCRLALEAIAPLRTEGREHLHPDEPVLIQSNHVSLFDPWFTITAAGHSIHFLASAAAMHDPLMGRVLHTFGSIPKKKFTRDVAALRTMKEWVRLGATVGSYPEGERSWDGELLPLLPHAESLVRLLNIPVVPVTILNADRVMPRWALRRRYGPVKVVFGRPRSFERKTPAARIRRWLEDQLRIDQGDERNHFPVRGRDLALGLEGALYRCPICSGWDALIPDGDELRCSACGATWRVNTRNQLLARFGPARSMTIAEARAAIRSRNLEHFVVDEPRFEREGVIAESLPVRMLDVTGQLAASLGRVRLRLRAESLEIRDRAGRPLFDFDLDELTNVCAEIRTRLTIRTKTGRAYEADMTRESPLKWAEMAEFWRQRRSRATPP